MLEKKLTHGYETSRRNGIEIEIENERHTCDDDNAMVVVLNCNHYWPQLTTEDHFQAREKAWRYQKPLVRRKNLKKFDKWEKIFLEEVHPSQRRNFD